MYNYIKALHIIFVVTWFSGLFYMVRLFIYNTEAAERNEMEKNVLRQQFTLMMRRLWFGITWPSAVLTLIFGLWMLFLYGSLPPWLWIKIGFVVCLYLYHFSLHYIFRKQVKGIFSYSSQQLRIWNEIATIFLIAIVMLAVVKQSISVFWGVIGLLSVALLLMSAIRISRQVRLKKNKNSKKMSL
jgi:protoporphyrinogen IX oxidase